MYHLCYCCTAENTKSHLHFSSRPSFLHIRPSLPSNPCCCALSRSLKQVTRARARSLSLLSRVCARSLSLYFSRPSPPLPPPSPPPPPPPPPPEAQETLFFRARQQKHLVLVVNMLRGPGVGVRVVSELCGNAITLVRPCRPCNCCMRTDTHGHIQTHEDARTHTHTQTHTASHTQLRKYTYIEIPAAV